MLKELFASVGIFLAGIFGGGYPTTAVAPSLNQPASAIVAISDTAQLAGEAASSSIATTTIVSRYTAQPVIEREVLAQNAVTREELDASLAAFRTDLLSILAGSLPKAYTFSGPAATTPISTETFAHSQKIDELANVTISNASLTGVSGLTTTDLSDFSYATSSNFVHIAAWGDSITSGYGGNNTSWPTQLSLLTGYSVYNGGKGGDTSTQINTRFSGQPDKFSYPTIIWSGRNNYSDPTTVQADIASMVASLTTENYIVLSILNGAGEGATTTAYSNITSLNNALATTYGSHYLDIRAYLVSQYDPTNPTDVDNFNSDVPPSSLRYDFLHPNTAGYLKIAQYIQTHISLLASISGSPLLTSYNLSQFAVSPPTFGFVNSQTGYQQDGTTVLVASSTKFTTFGGLGVGTSLTGSWNTGYGYQALYSGTTASANDAFGFQSLYNLTTGTNNAAFGVWALKVNTSGASNAAFSGSSLTNNTTGSRNTAIGFQAMGLNSTGSDNTALGNAAAYTGTTTARNTALGAQALRQNITGSDNAIVGYQSSYFNQSATSTVAVGVSAAKGTVNYSNQGGVVLGYNAGASFQTNSDYNTLVGYYAGNKITTGSNNIWLGTATSSTAIANLTTGSQNILIGNNISLPSATASGQLNIGNILYGTGITSTGSTLSSGSIGIGTTTPWRKLSITGTVGLDGLTGSTGAGSLCLSANREVVYNSGSDSCLSSTRVTKHDINPLVLDALAQVVALNPVSFIYNNDASSTVRYGFIAEDTASVDTHLATYDAQGAISGIDDRSIISIVVKAIQELGSKAAALFESDTAQNAQIAALEARIAALEGAAVAGSVSGNSPTPSDESEDAVPDTEAPTITINGNNPATLNVGDTYNDLGATVTDNVDINLGYRIFVGETPIEQAHIDTNEPNEWHIHYVATDNAGNTATSTRTVIVEAPTQLPAEIAEEPEQEMETELTP